jgi:hypothetical protein
MTSCFGFVLRKARDSKVGRKTRSSEVILVVRLLSKLSHDHFLPGPFDFVIHNHTVQCRVKSAMTFSTRIIIHVTKYAQCNWLPSTYFIKRSKTSQSGRLGDRGSIPGRGEMIFPLASVSRPALGPTQPPAQWVPWVLSSGVKCGRGVTLPLARS